MTNLFLKDWPEIWKPETTPSKLCQIYGDWGEFGIQNFARMSLTKCYLILQNARDAVFTVCKVLRENQQRPEGRRGKLLQTSKHAGYGGKISIIFESYSPPTPHLIPLLPLHQD